VVEGGEQCDGSDLNGAACAALGFSGGALACQALTCQLDTSGCTPAQPGGLHPHEPSGFSELANVRTLADGWAQGFCSGASSGNSCTHSARLADVPVAQVLGDTTHPLGGPTVIRGTMAQGVSPGTGPFSFYYNWANTAGPKAEVYVSYWVQWSTGNFQSSKIHFLGSSGRNVFYDSCGPVVLNATDHRSRSTVQGGAATLGDNGPAGDVTSFGPPLAQGQWHHVEQYWKMNTVNVADGVYRAWIDGQVAADHPNMAYRSSTNGVTTWDLFNWNPTMGVGNPAPLPDYYMYLAELFISGR
jgi:hypothetical protein